MLKRVFIIIAFVGLFSTAAFAQNSNSSTTKVRPRTTNTNANTNTNAPQAPKPAAEKPPVPKRTGAETPGSEAVLAAFDKLIAGIIHVSVDEVTGGYWNSPRLILFNYNGTVTKGWDQLKQNRESAYRDIKDVKLDVRDRHVTMLGNDGAVVTCLWTQSQTYKGAPDNASGRMTLVFRRVGNQWKAVHLHTSPDKPDPSRIPASEQTPTPTPTPKPSPKP
jgi:ketosteroid isomerase-like protein